MENDECSECHVVFFLWPHATGDSVLHDIETLSYAAGLCLLCQQSYTLILLRFWITHKCTQTHTTLLYRRLTLLVNHVLCCAPFALPSLALDWHKSSLHFLYDFIVIHGQEAYFGLMGVYIAHIALWKSSFVVSSTSAHVCIHAG